MPLYRSQVKDDLNLGVVADKPTGIPRTTTEKSKRYRKLDKYDQYYESKQYDKLRPWSEQRDESTGAYVPIRKRKPCIIYNLPKLFVEKAATKLAGSRQFPKFTVPVPGSEENDELTEQLLDILLTQSKLKVKAQDIAQEMLKSGSVYAGFSVVNGQFQTKFFNGKHCSPAFDEVTGDLEGVRVQYKYDDEQDTDPHGNPKKKWYRWEVDRLKETLYDNPEVKDEEKGEPEFKIVSQIPHLFGFVPGEWIQNGEMTGSIDGKSILEEILAMSDALNYHLSQSDQAITYTMDPQLFFTGMDTHEIDDLIKSATKTWNLGRDGKAQFLEIKGNGLVISKEFQGGISQRAQDMAKVVILDPEKLKGVYQSGKAMEVLHGPFVDLIHELRPWFGDYGLVPLVQKMLGAAILLNARGEGLNITFPKGYQPKSLTVELTWKPVFEPTLEDIQKAVSIASQAATSNIVTRVSATRFVQEYFGIKDPVAEQEAVIAQPLPPSPFGPFPM